MGSQKIPGMGYSDYASPDEKSDLQSGGSIKGTGGKGATKTASPFKMGYDSLPKPDEKQGDLGGSRVDNVRGC